MGDTIQLDIVTPEKVVLSEAVSMVTAPGTLGEFGVLPGHAAFVTTLEIGEVIIGAESQEQHVSIGGGFAQVIHDKMIILADSAEPAYEIDVKRAEAAKKNAEGKLQNLAREEREFQELDAARRRAENRIKVSSRKS